jgi:glucose/arabinose dehydrogenase
MRKFLFIFLTVCIANCNSDPSGTNGDGNGNNDVSYQVTDAFPNLSFNQPLDLQHAGDNSGRLFVVEKPGVIRVFNNESSTTNSSQFLDIRDRVQDSGGEEGLLGLAFHPNYETNGYFYVNYTADNPDRTVIARFEVSGQNPDQADASSEQQILTFAQPFANHNGGQLRFGPDGELYIAVGDGGSGGDPEENAQDRTTLLGSILRIDVDNQEDGNNYAIPADNPYAENSQGFREEILAYGLRNPWRFSFDADNGRLLAGDVGQGRFEEVNIIESGQNYGWDIMEGNSCYEPSSGCDQSGIELPIWEYGRSEGRSITGGFVYRGPTLDSLIGQYIYADFISGRIWALDYSDPDNPSNTEILNTDISVSSFGVDGDDELYILGFSGSIYRLETISN